MIHDEENDNPSNAEEVSPYTRVPDDSPLRCQSNNAYGQCNMIRQKNSTKCLVHSSGPGLKANETKEKRLYLVSKWQGKLDRQSSHMNLKSLNEEIGVLRILLEEKLNLCNDPMDLVLASASLGSLVLQIQQLVLSCHRLDKELGNMLDKTQAKQLGLEIIKIISEKINDPTIVESIANEIVKRIEQLATEQITKVVI